MLFGVGCSTEPDFVEHVSQNDLKKDITIYVVSHEWHTGFVIPVSLIQTKIPEIKQRFRTSPNIEFGWGDQGFYQADKITFGLTINAIFWPTNTVIHAVAVPTNISDYFPNSKMLPLSLSNSELESLVGFISNSFHRDSDGKIIPLSHGIYGNSQFYRAKGQYYLWNTCNTWTAKGLKSTGRDINPPFKITADSITNYLTSDNLLEQSP